MLILRAQTIFITFLYIIINILCNKLTFLYYIRTIFYTYNSLFSMNIIFKL